MIRVLYDNEIFKIQKFGGISRYFSELMAGLGSKTDFECLPSKYYSENKHLRINNLTHLDRFSDGATFRGKGRVVEYIKKREAYKLEKLTRAGAFEIFHPTYYNSSLFPLLPPDKPFVLTVYDMIHERYYDPYFEKVHAETKLKRNLIPRATHIVAISQGTKNDILELYPEIDEKKISVIYLGSSLVTEKLPDAPLTPANYLLFVGNRGFYKNFIWMLRAVSGLLKQTELQLVCAGGGGPFNEFEQAIIDKAGLKERVLYLDIHNDDDLIRVYKGAACFIFPSLYEGFGIPVLEAFSCGCPVILPNATCFPEIAGNAALYYESSDAHSLTKQIQQIINEPGIRNVLRLAGYERLKFFSWSNTVNQHMDLYRSIMQNQVKSGKANIST